MSRSDRVLQQFAPACAPSTSKHPSRAHVAQNAAIRVGLHVEFRAAYLTMRFAQAMARSARVAWITMLDAQQPTPEGHAMRSYARRRAAHAQRVYNDCVANLLRRSIPEDSI